MHQMPILFNYNDLMDEYPNRSSFNSFLNRQLKSGAVKQIKRGLYALVDPSTGAIYASKFQIASRLFEDSFFSYHEALEFYGLANQAFTSHFNYLTHTYVADIEFENVLYKSRKSECGLEVMDSMKENGVRIVSLERAIVDSIDSPDLGGGLEEIENVLKICPVPDITKVISMLEYYGKSFLYQKVGYLFERHFGQKISSSFYQLCLERIGKKYRYFEAKNGHSKRISKWHLMVPKEREIPSDIF